MSEVGEVGEIQYDWAACNRCRYCSSDFGDDWCLMSINTLMLNDDGYGKLTCPRFEEGKYIEPSEAIDILAKRGFIFDARGQQTMFKNIHPITVGQFAKNILFGDRKLLYDLGLSEEDFDED